MNKNLCISVKSVGQNFHRISRMNRRHSCYRITHGFARIFGRWPMARARYVMLLFLVTQISQMTQIFLRGEGLVPQISQIYTDFFESLVNRFIRSQRVSATTEQVASAKFRVIR